MQSVDVIGVILSDLCLEDNRHKLRKLKTNKNFRTLFLNYLKLLPGEDDQNFDINKCDNAVVFLVKNNDWEYSSELLSLFLDLEIIKKGFGNCYQFLSQMKPQNTENYKTLLKTSIGALKSLFMKIVSFRKIQDQCYRNILKLIRIILKNECFSDLLQSVVDAMCEMDCTVYKDENILQRLLHDLKSDFGSKHFYADIMLIRAQKLIIKLQEKDGFPKFSWKQCAALIPRHSKVTQFLRTNEVTFVYDSFESIGEAREWIDRHAGVKLNEGYSFTAVARECSGNVEVVIQKGREVHEIEKNKYLENANEFEKLKRKLKRFPARFSKISHFERPLITSGSYV